MSFLSVSIDTSPSPLILLVSSIKICYNILNTNRKGGICLSYEQEMKRTVNAVRQAVYADIEREAHPPAVIKYGKSKEQRIHELMYPRDHRLTPLTQAQIDQDLYDFCID